MIEPETDLEARIIGDPEWVDGAAWGAARPGHPEGSVVLHIVDVLANIESIALGADDRARLRLVALTHDTFKYQVDPARPRTGDNHHAVLARKFAARYITDDEILEVIELHDEAYNAWVNGERGGRWDAAEERAQRLLDRLGPGTPLYLRFYRADNATGSKDQASLAWFARLVKVRLAGSGD
jgi:hypothetical protein